MTDFNGITFKIVNGSAQVDKSTIDQEGDAQLATKVAGELKTAIEIGALEDGQTVVVKDSSGSWDIKSLDEPETKTDNTNKTGDTKGADGADKTDEKPTADKAKVDEFLELKKAYDKALAEYEPLEKAYGDSLGKYNTALGKYEDAVGAKTQLLGLKKDKVDLLNQYIDLYERKMADIEEKEDNQSCIMASMKNAKGKLEGVPGDAQRSIEAATFKAMITFDPSKYHSKQARQDAWKQYIAQQLGPIAETYKAELGAYADELSDLSNMYNDLSSELKLMYAQLGEISGNILGVQGDIAELQTQIDAQTTIINDSLDIMDKENENMEKLKDQMKGPLDTMAQTGTRMTELSVDIMDTYLLRYEGYLADGSDKNNKEMFGHNSTKDGVIDDYERGTFYTKNGFVTMSDVYNRDGSIAAFAGDIDPDAIDNWWKANKDDALTAFFGEEMMGKNGDDLKDMMMWGIDRSRDTRLTRGEMMAAAKSSGVTMNRNTIREDLKNFDKTIYNEAIRSGAVIGTPVSDEDENFTLLGNRYAPTLGGDVATSGLFNGGFNDGELTTEEIMEAIENTATKNGIDFLVNHAEQSDDILEVAERRGDLADDKVDSVELDKLIQDTCMNINLGINRKGDNNGGLGGFDKIINLAKKEGFLTDNDQRLDTAELRSLVQRYGIEILKVNGQYQFTQGND